MKRLYWFGLALVVGAIVIGGAVAASATKTKYITHFCYSVDPRGGATMHDMDTSPNHKAPPTWKRYCLKTLRGKNGPQGPQGPQGPAGNVNTYTVKAVGDGTVTAMCNGSDTALSGGFADLSQGEWPAASYKTEDGHGWIIKENKANTNDSGKDVTAYAYCVTS